LIIPLKEVRDESSLGEGGGEHVSNASYQKLDIYFMTDLTEQKFGGSNLFCLEKLQKIIYFNILRNAIAFMFMSVGCLLIYPLLLAIEGATFAEYALQFLNVWICLDTLSPFALLILRKLLMFLVLWPLLFLNFFSTRRVGARFQICSAIAKVLVFGFIVCSAVYLLVCKGVIHESIN
jgi:hypothetical protein